MIENSARKSLLPYDDHPNINDSASSQSPKTIPQTKFIINLQAQKYSEYQKFARLKDKSLVLREQPLPMMTQWLSNLDERYDVLYPQSKILLLWNVFMVIAILFNFFEIPMAIFLTGQVYESQVNTSIGLLLNSLFMLGFYVDMMLFGFNTAYYQKGKLIKSRKVIAQRFMKVRLWIDLISALSLTIYIASQTASLVYVKILFYLKVYSLIQIDKAINHYLQLHRRSFAVYRLVRIILFIWFITTWAGCIFFAIDYYYYNQQGFYYQQGQLWLTNSPAAGNLDLITNFSWDVWYEYALYWALQTSSTIGYGDLTPMNPPEVLYCCFVMLLMTVLFAFFINTVWEVISELQLSSIDYSENWQNLKLFLGGSKIPNETKQKISNYLYEVWQDNDNEEMEEIINEKLSKELREQFYVESRWKFFDSLGVFLNLTEFGERNNRFLGKLAHQIEEIKVGELEYIYREGDFDDCLYYVKKGKVSLNIEGSSFSQQCDFGESFGAIQVFQRTRRTQNAKAIAFSKLWTITYAQILNCTKKFPLMHEKFCEITQKMLFTRDISLLQTQCWGCRSSSHCLTQCPQINKWRKMLNQGNEKKYQIIQRKDMRRESMKSKKIISRQILYQKPKSIQLDKVTHTIYYTPYFNIK